MNVFTSTGSSANDGARLNIYNLLETAIAAPLEPSLSRSASWPEAAFFGTRAGATVTNMQSMRVGSPERKDGAAGGVATTAYALFIENTSAAAVGATSAFALCVEGGVSRFNSRVDIRDNIHTTGATLLLDTPDAPRHERRRTVRGPELGRWRQHHRAPG